MMKNKFKHAIISAVKILKKQLITMLWYEDIGQ